MCGAKTSLIPVSLVIVALLLWACGEPTLPAVPVTGSSTPVVVPEQQSIDGPVIMISPTSGGPNTVVTVTGSGFSADTDLSLAIELAGERQSAQLLASVRTDADGGFSETATIPDLWASNDYVNRQFTIVVSNQDGSARATAAFELVLTHEPVLILSPIAGEPGDRITVTGQGFPTGLDVQLRLGLPQTGLNNHALTRVVVDEHGAFATALELPVVWPGSGQPIVESELVVAAVEEGAGTLATATFLNMAALPVLAVNPSAGVAGQRVEVRGLGFEPGAVIGLRLGVPLTGLSDQDLLQVVADERGAFAVTLTIPTEWPGSDAPVIEPELVIAAVDQTNGTLATTIYTNSGDQ